MALIDRLVLLFAVFSSIFASINASDGDADSIYKVCVQKCEKSGCVGDNCFQHCNFSSAENSTDGPWYLQEPLYLRWKQWDCLGDCRYYCMLDREEERQKLGLKPVKYHGRWPFQRVYGIQEPVSVALSALNLAIQFHGWVSFFILVNYKLSFRPNRKPYYEYTGLWHIYAILSMNAWFWRAVFHSRDVDLTERLEQSSVVALLGFSLILAILRTFNVCIEAGRVMVSAPIVAFLTTHILYLNFYQFDHGLNRMICFAMVTAQLTMWAVWAGVSRHPSRWKLWAVVVGGVLVTLLEIFDFAPYWGFVDARAVSHAAAIPLTSLLWSFVKDDSELRTIILNKKAE
ncbi:unnamed protein product [Cuscuta europaea]|uniref:Post-GPI attachment to proteins factor 3 n=1 Tax=Cuscuta europaea TaxID=41803 RepID=A0A9P0ZGD7_CUSEU|nr:unnamed protein product [Cuscuta europaea]